eukprot:m.178653 g.178653  ORF g.178653 m.178653 type:complete len:68 (+) comp14640_c1_seq3:1470-1673(+)
MNCSKLSDSLKNYTEPMPMVGKASLFDLGAAYVHSFLISWFLKVHWHHTLSKHEARTCVCCACFCFI